MGVSMPKKPEMIDKLILLAEGDLDLVQEAIWAEAKDGKADLKKVVNYIVRALQNRDGKTAASARTYEAA